MAGYYSKEKIQERSQGTRDSVRASQKQQTYQDKVDRATGQKPKAGVQPKAKSKPSVRSGALRRGVGALGRGVGAVARAATPVAALSTVASIPPVSAGIDRGVRAFNESGKEGLGAVDEGIDAYLKGARDYMFGDGSQDPTFEQDAQANVAPVPEDTRPATFEQDVAGTEATSVRGANIGAEPYASELPTVATDPQLMEEGAEVQPSTIPKGVRQSQYDYAEDRPFQPGETGGMRLYSGEDALQDPQAKDLARQAASGEISTQQYNAGLRSIRQAQESGQGRGGDNASRLADSISRIEGELSRPGRGANQSLNDMLTEARVRKNKRKALDELYGLQKQEQTISSAEGISTANRESREAIAEQKSIADRNKEARAASVRAEQETYERKKYVEKEGYTRARNVLADETASASKKATAMKDATTVYKEDAKARFPEDRGRQNMHTAKMQMTHVKPGDSYFTTPEGRIARKDTSEQLHKYMSSERGLVDWIANIPGMVGLGRDDRYSQEDIENMDFSSFNIDDAGEGAYVFRSTIRNADGSHAEYAYQHSMTPEFVSVMRKLIANDKAKKAKSGVRAAQAQRQKDTAEYIRSQ